MGFIKFRSLDEGPDGAETEGIYLLIPVCLKQHMRVVLRLGNKCELEPAAPTGNNSVTARVRNYYLGDTDSNRKQNRKEQFLASSRLPVSF